MANDTTLENLLQYHRPQAMHDAEVQEYLTSLISADFFLGQNLKQDRDRFIEKFDKWVLNSNLNHLKNLTSLPFKDVIVGVTQYLDEIHQIKQNVCVLNAEYLYHWRIYGEKLRVKTVDSLEENDNLIISMPFPAYGDIHPDMHKIIRVAEEKNVSLHIDGCWYGCCRDINFDFSSPAIKSAAFSLSKSLGLGVNRIGVRYTRERWTGPIALQNDYNMTIQSLMWIGENFIDKFGSDFWHRKYGKVYDYVCEKYDLGKTKAIHIAWDRNKDCPVGIRKLLRNYYGE